MDQIIDRKFYDDEIAVINFQDAVYIYHQDYAEYPIALSDEDLEAIVESRKERLNIK